MSPHPVRPCEAARMKTKRQRIFVYWLGSSSRSGPASAGSMVAGGACHSALLRSDGRAALFGSDCRGHRSVSGSSTASGVRDFAPLALEWGFGSGGRQRVRPRTAHLKWRVGGSDAPRSVHRKPASKDRAEPGDRVHPGTHAGCTIGCCV